MSAWHIQLFDTLCVRHTEDEPLVLEAGKAQELLCYLLLHRGRAHPRDILADVLWGDGGSDQSRKYLRKALWQVQGALHSGGQSGEPAVPVLAVGPDAVGVNTTADLWMDVAIVEQAYAGVQGVRGKDLDEEHAHTLERAVDLYHGDLLNGWYQEWCVYERQRLQAMYLAMLDKLMGYCEVHNAYETGIAYGLRILRYDQAQERTHRRLMRLHYFAGDRTAALRQYASCVAALDDDLGVKPARSTITLYEQIRADCLDHASMVAVPAESPSTSSLADAVEHLKHLCTTLADLQQRVQTDLHVVEAALKERA